MLTVTPRVAPVRRRAHKFLETVLRFQLRFCFCYGISGRRNPYRYIVSWHVRTDILLLNDIIAQPYYKPWRSGHALTQLRARTHTHTHRTCLATQRCVHTHARARARTHTHTHTHTHTNTHTHTRARAHTHSASLA